MSNFVTANHRRIFTFLFAILAICTGESTTFAQAREGGEAALKLPDLSEVTFLGVDGHRLLLVGLLFCFLGLLFGLAIYIRSEERRVGKGGKCASTRSSVNE